MTRTAPGLFLGFALLLAGLGCVGAGAAHAGGIDPLFRSQLLEQLDRLGITSGGAYSSKQPLDTDLTALAGISGTRGDVIIYGASGWTRLAAGSTSGHVLTSNGAAADPSYQAAAASGWTDNGTTVTATADTDGVGIGDSTIESTFKLAVVGDADRPIIYLEPHATGYVHVQGDAQVTGGVTASGGAFTSVVQAAATDLQVIGGSVNTDGAVRLRTGNSGAVATRWSVETAGALTPFADDTYDVGSSTLGVRTIYLGGAGALFDAGTATPEGAITAPVGSLFVNTSATTPGTIFYGKFSGSGNTGWVTLAPSTAWAAAGVTANWTNQTTTSLMRRVGDVAEYQILVTATGDPGAASLILTLDQTVDEAKTLAGSMPCGFGYVQDNGAATRGMIMAVYSDSTNTVTAFICTTQPSTLTNVSDTVPITIGTDDTVVLNVIVPITGW